eukprot:TRINITY_DN44333_c0_g1_i1.p1 TRINITY_DN44333_c0_g1~~TRINITY_DN44333_c0_g1_i1.p1  ORF type:complete len:496 (-),score=67.72 TRINITY_DN44333_c0_g1_i1:6-1349(-)
MDSEQPICRICFADASDDASQPLVSPCKCQGSQKYVHVTCLRHWQRSVQLDAPNHPQDSWREARHEICGVCKSPFDLRPEDRATLLAELACVEPADVSPGLVIVTKTTVAESVARSSQLNIVVRAFIELKAAHFREAVYIITEVNGGEAGGGSDVVLGVNLSRALEAPDVDMLDGCPKETELRAYASEKSVEVRWMNGGPCKPRVVTSLYLVKHVPRTDHTELFARCGAIELVSDDAGALVSGSLASLLAVAAEDVARRPSGSTANPTVVLAWAGFAQWSRAQLLGELARGSWGWCRARCADVSDAVSALSSTGSTQSLWTILRASSRLFWAPDNELSREFTRRHDRFLRETRGAPEDRRDGDREDAAVHAYVQEFEQRRRGADLRRVYGMRGAPGGGGGGAGTDAGGAGGNGGTRAGGLRGGDGADLGGEGGTAAGGANSLSCMQQ